MWTIYCWMPNSIKTLPLSYRMLMTLYSDSYAQQAHLIQEASGALHVHRDSGIPKAAGAARFAKGPRS